MKYLIRQWTKDNDGILYFFQRLEEMLFHYSSDIVRVPIHNTRTLVEEYLTIVKEINKGVVKKYQIDPIQSELCENIKTDKILLGRFGEKFLEDIVQGIKNEKDDMVKYFYRKIDPKTYYKWCINYIKEHATQPNHKEEIEFGLRAWIVEMISSGYSPEYIYNFLHISTTDNTMTPKEILFRFLERFSLKKEQYRVYLSLNPILSEYKTLLNQRLHISFEDDNYFHKCRIYKKDLVGYFDLDSLDDYSAVIVAFKKLDVFIKYYRVISNQRTEIVRKYGFVRGIDKTDVIKLPTKPFGYHTIETKPRENLKETVDQVIISCQNKTVTYLQLNKMVALHNSAISQQDLNNGFLNLWSILEIVTSDIPCESKIEKVISGIIPILQKDYFSALCENIHDDLLDNLSATDYENLMKEVTADSPWIAIAKFIFLPEYKDLLELYYFKKLERYPVIRQKIYRLNELRNEKSKLIQLSNKYAKRVRWHIYRLYRTRNSIVHSGKSHHRIQSLGEHLHIYVDQILFELLLKLSNEKTLITISDVLIDAKLMLQKISKTFSENSPIDDSDISILLDNYYYKTSK